MRIRISGNGSGVTSHLLARKVVAQALWTHSSPRSIARQSIECALNTVKAHSYTDSHSARQPPPASPLGEYTTISPFLLHPLGDHGRQDKMPIPNCPVYPCIPPRKLGTKYSLLNLFRKAVDTGIGTPESPYNRSSFASPSPAPATFTNLAPIEPRASHPRTLASSQPAPSADGER